MFCDCECVFDKKKTGKNQKLILLSTDALLLTCFYANDPREIKMENNCFQIFPPHFTYSFPPRFYLMVSGEEEKAEDCRSF